MNLYSQVRKDVRLLWQWKLAPPKARHARGLQKLGSDYGGYYLDGSRIGRDAIVYSLGIGEDISFDLSLIEKFGADVEAFDPTPKVKDWLARQTLPQSFHFHPVGIAGREGAITFYLPAHEEWVSHSICPARQYHRQSVRLPVTRLRDAMQRNGHSRIDLLKMDIEGAEYAVIEEIVSERIPIGQLLVEFHHRLTSVGTGKTRKALALLERHGMRISYICPQREIFTFVQTL
jgi:FkbM family methyltransferase